MVATDFDQHVKYMSALRDEFASQSDVKYIKQIGEVKQWLQDACSAKDHEVMEAIKGMVFKTGTLPLATSNVVHCVCVAHRVVYNAAYNNTHCQHRPYSHGSTVADRCNISTCTGCT